MSVTSVAEIHPAHLPPGDCPCITVMCRYVIIRIGRVIRKKYRGCMKKLLLIAIIGLGGMFQTALGQGSPQPSIVQPVGFVHRKGKLPRDPTRPSAIPSPGSQG